MSLTVSLFDIGLASVAVALLFFVHEIALGLKTLAVNTATGLCVLGVCHLLGLGIVLTPLVMFEIAIGGIPAAILVVIIAYLGIAVYPV